MEIHIYKSGMLFI